MYKIIARILGNFGVGFFGPLVGSGVAQTFFHNLILFDQALMVAAISAALTTGLSASYEIRKYGESRNGKK